MQLDYEHALHLEGKLIEFKNKRGEWSIGRVKTVKKAGLEIEELNPHHSDDGYGFGFFGPRPFWGPPVFFPFVGFAVVPFFLW